MTISKTTGTIGLFAVLAGIAGGATIATRDVWWPRMGGSAGGKVVAEDSHAGHDHGSGGHAEGSSDSVLLSEQARENLGLKLAAVDLSDYTRHVSIPGVVVEQPGHSERRITTSVAGIVVKMHAFPGQVVTPGDRLADLQPAGDVLTDAQADLLKTTQELELLVAEIKRIEPLVANGSIPARTKIEKEYEQKRLESQKRVQIQELLVRGLSPYQITEIVEHQTLLREFTIYVPGAPPKGMTIDEHDHPSAVPQEFWPKTETTTSSGEPVVYSVEKIDVFPGKLVQPGEEICDLALHTELYIEGHAFEKDSPLIARAVKEQLPLSAIFEGDADGAETRTGLQIRFVENSVEAATRTLRFFVPIKNEVLSNTTAANGVVYRTWRFKPGQKVKLLLPAETFKEQLVVPAEAVVNDGADAYVFRSNGKMMERVPVVIEHRDARAAVLRNDGSLFPGDEIAMNQAYQIYLALRKQQSSGVDLHAGHNH